MKEEFLELCEKHIGTCKIKERIHRPEDFKNRVYDAKCKHCQKLVSAHSIYWLKRMQRILDLEPEKQSDFELVSLWETGDIGGQSFETEPPEIRTVDYTRLKIRHYAELQDLVEWVREMTDEYVEDKTSCQKDGAEGLADKLLNSLKKDMKDYEYYELER